MRNTLCGYCTQPSCMTDATGRHWCPDHRFRGDFLTLGAKHGFPSLTFPPYAVMHGQYFWEVNAAVAREECVRHLLNALTILWRDDTLEEET